MATSIQLAGDERIQLGIFAQRLYDIERTLTQLRDEIEHFAYETIVPAGTRDAFMGEVDAEIESRKAAA